MVAARSCSVCGKPLPPIVGQGRPRTKCVTCSPVRKSNAARTPHKARELPAPIVPEVPVGSLLTATRARLEALGLLDDPSGVAAMALAQRVDAGADSGASMAALVRQHAASMADAAGHAAVADDPLDELARRRDEKRGSA